jgi:hypothetical protein
MRDRSRNSYAVHPFDVRLDDEGCIMTPPFGMCRYPGVLSWQN